MDGDRLILPRRNPWSGCCSRPLTPNPGLRLYLYLRARWEINIGSLLLLLLFVTNSLGKVLKVTISPGAILDFSLVVYMAGSLPWSIPLHHEIGPYVILGRLDFCIMWRASEHSRVE